MKTYQVIARTLGALKRCIDSGNTEWIERHSDRLKTLLEDFPSGSGFDCGTKLDLDSLEPDKLIFTTSFHHMNESGMYDGWTEHAVIVTPSMELGYRLRITGRDRNGIKEMIGDVFSECLDADVPEFAAYPQTA